MLSVLGVLTRIVKLWKDLVELEQMIIATLKLTLCSNTAPIHISSLRKVYQSLGKECL